MTIVLNALVNAGNQSWFISAVTAALPCEGALPLDGVYRNPLITCILLKEASVRHFVLVQLITQFNFSSKYTTVLSEPSGNYYSTVRQGKWLN